MADMSDVADALVTAVAAVVYPNGTSAASITGAPVRIFQGWPSPQQLDTDLPAGTVNVSVWPTPRESIVPGALSLDFQQSSAAVTPSLTARVSGQTIILGGAMPSPFAPTNMVALINGKQYAYAVVSTDTIASIATALAGLIAVDWPGTSASAGVISLPQGRVGIDFIVGASALGQGAANITAARSGTTGQAIRETRRQERTFQITVWANAPSLRDPLASAIDSALSSIFRLTLPDGSYGQVRYRGATQQDALQKQAIYRRDLMYAVEYGATQTITATQITAEQLNLTGQIDGASVAGPTTTTYQ